MVSFFKRTQSPAGSADNPAVNPVGLAVPVTVTLIGKPGCHLCEDAREVVLRVAAETGAAVEESDITADDFDPALRDEYWEQIPVTLVNGARHDFWHVDEARLREAVASAGRKRG